VRSLTHDLPCGIIILDHQHIASSVWHLCRSLLLFGVHFDSNLVLKNINRHCIHGLVSLFCGEVVPYEYCSKGMSYLREHFREKTIREPYSEEAHCGVLPL